MLEGEGGGDGDPTEISDPAGLESRLTQIRVCIFFQFFKLMKNSKPQFSLFEINFDNILLFKNRLIFSFSFNFW